MTKYVAPGFQTQAFTCPHCEVLAQFTWSGLMTTDGLSSHGMSMAVCTHCDKPTYWLQVRNAKNVWIGRMIYPLQASAPPPHSEMPQSIVPDYEEARSIAGVSPRGASALLRVCVEKLCDALHAEGGSLNEKIGWLVRQGLPAKIQQALDTVRVIGNNAVHPGHMDDKDVAAVCDSLFHLINLIVEDRISQPKMIEEMFKGLPEGSLEAIERRDSAK